MRTAGIKAASVVKIFSSDDSCVDRCRGTLADPNAGQQSRRLRNVYRLERRALAFRREVVISTQAMPAKRARMGRPPKPKAALRTETIQLKLSAAEKEQIDRAAALDLLPTAVWLRSRALSIAEKRLDEDE
jgi:hypothetical protein